MPLKKPPAIFTKNKGPRVKTAAMRNPAIYILSVVILVVVFVAFILGPILGGTTNTEGLLFGSYRGRSIRYEAGSYFVRAYESQYQQELERAQQANRTTGLQDAYSAIKDAYDSTVFRYGLLDMAESSRVNVSTEEITQTLATAPRFRDENGNFSSDLLRRTLSTEPGLRDEIRDDLLFTKVQDDLFNASRPSDAEIQFITDMGKDKRIFDIVSFSFEEYPDAELLSYLEEANDLFRSIELSSITVDSLTEAEQLLERLNNNESNFEDIASANSVDIYSEENGSRGLVWYHTIQRDFEDENTTDLLFELEDGQTSEIFQIRGERYAIYRADSSVKEPDKDDPALIEQLRNYVTSFERGRISDYFRTQAEDFILLSEEIGWTSAAIQLGVSPVETTALGINYGDLPIFPTVENASSGLLAGASTREVLLTDMFSLEPGELSDPAELRDRIVVIRYDRLAEEPEDQGSFLENYLPFLTQEYLVAEMRRSFSSPENLNDNFEDAFQEAFTPSN